MIFGDFENTVLANRFYFKWYLHSLMIHSQLEYKLNTAIFKKVKLESPKNGCVTLCKAIMQASIFHSSNVQARLLRVNKASIIAGKLYFCCLGIQIYNLHLDIFSIQF